MITPENEITRFFENLGLNLKIHRDGIIGHPLNGMLLSLQVLPGGKIEPHRVRPLLRYYFRDIRGTKNRNKVFLDDFNPDGHGLAGICKKCGCTQNDACTGQKTSTGTCYWVDDNQDLCSACVTGVEKAKYTALEVIDRAKNFKNFINDLKEDGLKIS